MYSIENKSEDSRAIQNNSEKHESIAQFKDNRSLSIVEVGENTAQLEKKENLTGMPDDLKEGIESFSGFSMDDVRVHYNSSKPATVQALAYTQGTDIHVAPGQEKHLPHEAWHVAQQMAGRVSPTTNINGMPVNDNVELEHEADVMGEKAVQCKMQENGKIYQCNGTENDLRKGNASFNNGVYQCERTQNPFDSGPNINNVQKQDDHIIPDHLIGALCDNIRNSINLQAQKKPNDSIVGNPAWRTWVCTAATNFMNCKDVLPACKDEFRTLYENIRYGRVTYKEMYDSLQEETGQLRQVLEWMPGNIIRTYRHGVEGKYPSKREFDHAEKFDTLIDNIPSGRAKKFFHLAIKNGIKQDKISLFYHDVYNKLDNLNNLSKKDYKELYKKLRILANINKIYKTEPEDWQRSEDGGTEKFHPIS